MKRGRALYPIVKRIFDIGFATLLVIVCAVPFGIIGIVIKVTSEGDVLFWSERIGIHNSRFMMPKFRTMRTNTPQLPTHLLADSANFVTPVGRFLRKLSLDEIPQLWSILKGDMSFVGPRPALFNQDDLVQLRSEAGVDNIVPGLTGWAQINGRDSVSISEKAALDAYYYQNRSCSLDLKILAKTVLNVIKGSDISH